jgi:hypothetical protein
MVDSVIVNITDNQLVGKGSASVSGYPKVFAGYRLDRAQEEDVKKYVTRLVGKGSNKFYLDKYNIANLNDNDKPTRIQYDFRIGDYFQKISDEIYINLNLNKEFYNEYINVANRKTPWENDYKYVRDEVCVLTIPEGYTIDYLPKNTNYNGHNVGLEVNYEVEPGKVVLKKRLYIDYLMLETSDFAGWNEAVKNLSEAYKESIILKKK